jgi:general secretion pathway protein M
MATFNERIVVARERFLALTPRERWMVASCVTVVVLTILYLAIWEPVADAHAQRLTRLGTERATAQQLEEAAALIGNRGNRTAPAATVGRDVSLLAAIDQSVKRSAIGKAPERLQPEGDREVRVWFTGVPFDAVITWLNDLQIRYGVTIQTLDVERQDTPGVVDARVSLTRGA